MSDSIQFWLDNKMSAGLKVAAIGDQVLVVYREKYFVVEKDAAQTRGGKSLRYSKSSLPAIWKRALKGEILPAEALVMPADDALPLPTAPRRERSAKKKPLQTSPADAQPSASDKSAAPANGQKPAANRKIADIKTSSPATVIAACPQCHLRHDLPLEKGKNGKPFFVACARCKADFAVRYVQVMTYQAQVAGFPRGA